MKIGIIGGTGLYALDSLAGVGRGEVDTPFGSPSDAFVTGTLDGVEVVFLARHGEGHHILPSELNHRANIFALKTLGVERVIAVSAVGSLREELAPGDLVLVDQYVDRTKRGGEHHTFFGNGAVAHVGFGDPTCSVLRDEIFNEANAVLPNKPKTGLANRPPRIHPSGTYINMEGPAFSTRAESFLYKSWGMDVVGMTNLAEAKLCREAEMCFCAMAFVTDYDCWHDVHEAVSVQMILDVLSRNAESAKEILSRVIPVCGREHEPACGCRNALAMALVTDPSIVPVETKEALRPLVGKYWTG